MNLPQIKNAVNSGLTVHWSNSLYSVVKDSKNQWLIVCSNGSAIGLTHSNGTTLNGRESEFYVSVDIKTLDINALEWFDKSAGNSYFAAEMVINYGMENSATIKIPFQYGYGDHYITTAINILKDFGIFPAYPLRLREWCEERKIILRTSKQTGCLKRDLINLTK